MYNEKRNGLRIESCGTPDTTDVDVEKVPSAITLKRLERPTFVNKIESKIGEFTREELLLNTELVNAFKV